MSFKASAGLAVILVAAVALTGIGVMISPHFQFAITGAATYSGQGACGSYVNESSTLTGNVGPCDGSPGANLQFDGFIINASDIVLDCQGNSIQGGASGVGYGINNTGHTNVTLINCTITAFNDGVYYKDANNGSIMYSNVTVNTNNGIWLNNSMYGWVFNTTSSFNTNDGIYAYFSNWTHVENSSVLNNSANGVHFQYSNNCTIDPTIISGHTNGVVSGVYLQDCIGTDVADNMIIQNNYGVVDEWFSAASSFTVIDSNTFDSNQNYEVQLFNADGVIIEYNDFLNCKTCIAIGDPVFGGGSDSATVRYNVFDTVTTDCVAFFSSSSNNNIGPDNEFYSYTDAFDETDPGFAGAGNQIFNSFFEELYPYASSVDWTVCDNTGDNLADYGAGLPFEDDSTPHSGCCQAIDCAGANFCDNSRACAAEYAECVACAGGNVCGGPSCDTDDQCGDHCGQTPGGLFYCADAAGTCVGDTAGCTAYSAGQYTCETGTTENLCNIGGAGTWDGSSACAANAGANNGEFPVDHSSPPDFCGYDFETCGEPAGCAVTHVDCLDYLATNPGFASCRNAGDGGTYCDTGCGAAFGPTSDFSAFVSGAGAAAQCEYDRSIQADCSDGATVDACAWADVAPYLNDGGDLCYFDTDADGIVCEDVNGCEMTNENCPDGCWNDAGGGACALATRTNPAPADTWWYTDTCTFGGCVLTVSAAADANSCDQGDPVTGITNGETCLLAGELSGTTCFWDADGATDCIGTNCNQESVCAYVAATVSGAGAGAVCNYAIDGDYCEATTGCDIDNEACPHCNVGAFQDDPADTCYFDVDFDGIYCEDINGGDSATETCVDFCWNGANTGGACGMTTRTNPVPADTLWYTDTCVDTGCSLTTSDTADPNSCDQGDGTGIINGPACLSAGTLDVGICYWDGDGATDCVGTTCNQADACAYTSATVVGAGAGATCHYSATGDWCIATTGCVDDIQACAYADVAPVVAGGNCYYDTNGNGQTCEDTIGCDVSVDPCLYGSATLDDGADTCYYDPTTGYCVDTTGCGLVNENCPDWCINDADGGACAVTNHENDNLDVAQTCNYVDTCVDAGCALTGADPLDAGECDVCTAIGTDPGAVCPAATAECAAACPNAGDIYQDTVNLDVVRTNDCAITVCNIADIGDWADGIIYTIAGGPVCDPTECELDKGAGASCVGGICTGPEPGGGGGGTTTYTPGPTGPEDIVPLCQGMVGNIVSSTLWGSTAFKGILQRDVTVIIDEDCGEAASTEYKVADECVYDGALDSGTDFMLFTDMRLPLEIVQGMASIPQQVECGGGACFECVVDKDCLLNSDCQSQVCAAEEVKVPNLFELMGRLDIWNTFVWMASNLNMQLQVSGYGQEMGYPSLDLVDEPSESGKTCQTAVEDLAFQLQAKDGLVTFEGEIVDLSPFTPGFGTGAGILTGAGDLSDITETKTDGPLTVGFGADPSSGTATMAFITRGDGPGTIEFTIRSAGAESTEFFDIHPGTVVGPVAFTLDPASFGEDTLFNIIFTGPASRANVQFRATFTARTTPEESADIAEMKRIFSAEVNSQIAQIAVGTAEVNRLWDQLHAPITIRPRPPTITFPEFPAAPEITPPPTVTVTTCTYPDGFMVVYSGQWAEPWAMNMIYGESGETTLLPGEDNTVACHWIPSEHEFELSAGYGSCADFVRDGLEAQSGFSDCVAAVKQNLVSPESLVLEATLRGGFAEGLTLISTQGFTTFVVGNTDESSQTISQPYTGPVGPEGEIPWELVLVR